MEASDPLWLARLKKQLGDPWRSCPDGIQKAHGWRRFWIWQVHGRTHTINIDRISRYQVRVSLLSQSQLTWYGREMPNSVRMIQMMHVVQFGQPW